MRSSKQVVKNRQSKPAFKAYFNRLSFDLKQKRKFANGSQGN